MQMPNGMANGMSMQMQPQLTPGFQTPSLQQPMQAPPLQQHMNMQQLQPGRMGNTIANPQMMQNQGLQQNMPQQPPPRVSPEEEHMITQLAVHLQQTYTPDQMETVNQRVKAFPLEMKQKISQQGMSPQQFWFKTIAARQWQMSKIQKARQAALRQQQQLGRQDNGLVNQLNQQARPTPRNPNTLEQPVPGAGPNQTAFEGGGNVKNNMHEINALQQEAMRSQELGHQVVPASNTQPMAPPNQQQRMNIQNTPRQQPIVQQSTQQSTMPNIQHQQRLARQQQSEQLQARMAQMQSQTPQQTPLTGQYGGLTTNLGQDVPRQSPAMPTLNKPLEQSTQQGQGQGTPNQRQQQQPTPDQNTIGQRVTQQSQEPNIGLPQINPAQLNAIISRFPPFWQQRLSGMSHAERTRATITLLKKTNNFKNLGSMIGRPPGVAPNAFPGNSQNMPPSHDQQSRAMLSGQQNSGAQQGFNAPVPQMRGSNQSNLQAGQQQWGFQGTPNPQGLSGMMGAQHLSNDGKNQQGPAPTLTVDQVRLMDTQPFPHGILGTTFAGMPPTVRTWGNLKAWVTQSPEIVSKEVIEKLRNLQALHYRSMVTAGQNQFPTNAQTAPVTASMLPQAPVPTAQMVPTGTQPTMQNGNNAALRPGQGAALAQRPTLQDVQSYRPRLPPQWSHLTDQQISEQIFIRRAKAAQAQAQQNLNAQQPSIQVMQQMNNLQRGFSATPGNQNAQNHQQPNRQAPGKVPTSTKPSPNPGNATPAQQMRVNQPNAPQTMAKGVKRGSADDVVEVPNPNLLQQQPPQNQKLGKQGQANQQQGLQQPGHDRAQYEAELRKLAAPGIPPPATKPTPNLRPGQMNPAISGQGAQQPHQQAPLQYQPPSEEEVMQRRARIIHLQQEISQNLPQRALMPLDADASRNMAVLLQREFQLLSKAENAIHFYYIKMRGPEATVRDLLIMVGPQLT